MGRLPVRTKIFFGMGGMAMVLPDLVFTQWIFVRYAPDQAHALVPVAWFGLFVLSARIVGALGEPIFGHWSDNFRSPSGRRLPFVRRGLVPFALSFFLLWIPPMSGLHWTNAVHVLVLMHLYLLCYPLVLTPYLALLPELTTDLKERVSLTTVHAIFVMIASIAFAGMGAILDLAGWVMLGAVVAVVMLVALTPVAIAVREEPVAGPREKEPLLRSILVILGNRPFRHLLLAVSFFSFGFNSVLVSVPFWVKDYLNRDASTVTLLMIPFLVTTMVLFAVVGPLVGRFGKYRMFLASLMGTTLCLGAVGLVGYLPLLSPLLQMGLLILLLGVPMTGFMVLPFALLSDVIDYDEKRTGRRREALFFAVQGTIQKIFSGFSGLVFAVLAYRGPEGNVSVGGLRWVAAAAAAGLLSGFLIFLRYPIRERDGRAVYPDLPA